MRKYVERASQNGVSIGLRVNPEFSVLPMIFIILVNPFRFGATAEQLGDALPQGIEGFHFHALFEADSFALEKVLEVS